MYDSVSFGLMVAYGKTKELQCAFIVSKKVSLKSTVRHEVKRKMADGMARFLPRIGNSSQMVFLPKQKMVEINREDFNKELEAVLKRAKLLT